MSLTPSAWGAALVRASLKSTPHDFIVRERLDIEFAEQGEHLYLLVQKCDLNTHDIAEKLQRSFSVDSVDIGLCGLKDKQAVTEQWFSVKTTGTSVNNCALGASIKNTNVALQAGEFRILKEVRHTRKLRRGAHRGNDFTVVLRNLDSIDEATALDQSSPTLHSIEHRLSTIRTQGFANYFGPQRFGFDSANVAKAERMFSNGSRRVSRTKRGILLSAARSHLFNQVCAERVRQGSWNTPLLGEPLLLNGTQSFFIYSESDSDTIHRVNSLDVHTSGPMFGKGDSPCTQACANIESSVLSQFDALLLGLQKAGLKQQRRSLRALVSDLKWCWEDPTILKLDFFLSKGVYATSFLAEFAELK